MTFRGQPFQAAAVSPVSAGRVASILWVLGTFGALCLCDLLRLPWFAWAGVVFAGCWNPCSSLFLLASSQVMFNLTVPGLTGTQAFILIWLVRNIPGMVRGEFWGPLRTLAFFLFPLLGWSFISGVANSNQEQTSILMTVLGTVVVAGIEFRRVRPDQRHIGVLGIALACFLAALPYWFSKVNISFASAANRPDSQMFMAPTKTAREMRVTRGGVERFAATGVNVNYAAACMDIAIAGFVAFLLMPVSKGHSPAARLGRWSCVAPTILCFPAVLATMSRGSALGAPLALATPIGIRLLGNRNRSILVLMGQALAAFAAIAVLLIVAWVVVGAETAEYIDAIMVYSQGEGAGATEGRAHVFERGLSALTGSIGSPLFGNVRLTGADTHNVFLEAASYSGVPGFAMITLTLLYPLGYYAIRRNLATNMEGYLAIYAIAVYTGLHTGIMSFKILWMTWIILMDYWRRKANGTLDEEPNGRTT